jgi:hypothetical protein
MPTKSDITVVPVEPLDGGGASAFVTTRLGGHSRGAYRSLNLARHVGDDLATVERNRRCLADATGVDPADWVFAAQPHGAHVSVVSAAERGAGALDGRPPVARADALVTDVADLCLAVLVADCVPVLLRSARGNAVGIAHAGWRGTVGHIAGKTVRTMAEAFGCPPESISAALGPSIGPDDYLVGDEVAAAFRSAYSEGWREIVRRNADGRWRLDLWTANAADLEAAGVRPDRIAPPNASTAARTDLYYSHRMEGRTGRFAAAVRLVTLGT